MNTNQNEPRVKLLTIRQAAGVIDRLTEYRIRQLFRAGELPCVKVGKRYFINEQTLINTISAMDKRKDSKARIEELDALIERLYVDNASGKVTYRPRIC